MQTKRISTIAAVALAGAMTITGVSAVSCLGGGTQSAIAEPAKPAGQTGKVVFKLDHGTNDLHAVFMTLKLATKMAGAGQDVTLFVNLEAVRLADKRQPNALRWGMSDKTVGQLYDGFVAAGGKVLVCPHCAEAAGMKDGDLRPGAMIGTEDAVVKALTEADKVIDY